MDRTAYFDNAATTFPKPKEVYQFMDSSYRGYGVNVGRGQHKLAAQAAAMVAETRSLILELNHCPNKTVVFTPTATEALNVILNSVIKKNKMNVYISPFEHNAVVRVINHLQQIYDISIYTLAFDKTMLAYDIEKIKCQFVDEKPNAVIVSHASNVNGILAPVAEICALAKTHSSITIIDMCQTMGLINIDLNNDNIDFTVFSAHKTLYGSMGLGGFICIPNAKLDPLIYGGTGIDSSNPNLPDTIPERYEVGTQNLPAIAGLNAALKWMRNIGIENIYKKEQENRRRLIEILVKYDNIKIVFCPQDEKQAIGVVSCIFAGYGSDNIGQVLSDKDIAVRTGLHCAPNAHQFMGTFPAGTVRFSVSYFNTDEEFKQLKEALNYIHENS